MDFIYFNEKNNKLAFETTNPYLIVYYVNLFEENLIDADCITFTPHSTRRGFPTGTLWVNLDNFNRYRFKDVADVKYHLVLSETYPLSILFYYDFRTFGYISDIYLPEIYQPCASVLEELGIVPTGPTKTDSIETDSIETDSIETDSIEIDTLRDQYREALSLLYVEPDFDTVCLGSTDEEEEDPHVSDEELDVFFELPPLDEIYYGEI